MRHVNHTLIAVALAGLALVPVAATAIPPMLPGLWELRVTTSLSRRALPPETLRECLSQKDIEHETRTLPLPEGKCTLSNVLTTGGRTTYDMACVQDDYTTRGHMELYTRADAYDGQSELTTSAPGRSDTPMTVLFNAKRIGDCTK